MIKKCMRYLSPLFIVFLLLMGCSNDSGNNNQGESTDNQTGTEENNAQTGDVEEESVSITISEDEGDEVHTEKEVDIEEGAILLDVLKEHFDIEEEGGFINAVDGMESDEEEGKFWLYDVNGDMADVGADELELSPGDDVVFDLQAVE